LKQKAARHAAVVKNTHRLGALRLARAATQRRADRSLKFRQLSADAWQMCDIRRSNSRKHSRGGTFAVYTNKHQTKNKQITKVLPFFSIEAKVR
jgi:hypothetical protein